MIIESFELSDIGGRDENQDVTGYFSDNKLMRHCFVVADGLGGHTGGRQAAEIAVSHILNNFFRITKDNVNKLLPEIILESHNSIKAKERQDPLFNGMTTCAVATLLDNNAYLTTIGDSRIYIFRKGKIVFKSRDDSMVQILIDLKEIREEDAANHPDRNRVLKALGIPDGITPEICSEKLEHDDHLLLCSDGFWENVPDNELKDFFKKGLDKSVSEKGKDLFLKAASRGKQLNKKHDNISLQLVTVT